MKSVLYLLKIFQAKQASYLAPLLFFYEKNIP